MPSDKKKPEMISITLDHEGLLAAARAILVPETAKPTLDGIEARAKWKLIKKQYRTYLSIGVESKPAMQKLAKLHDHSVKTIEAIIYER